MTSLVACLSVGKGTWLTVHKLIMGQEWESIVLITNQLGKDKFACSKSCDFIIVDSDRPVKEMTKEIKEKLQGRFNDLEVALNISSGTGKEHMAIISAILQSGLSFRLVDAGETGMVEV
jgi:hypothetical protein